jgi:sugar O-acyltransferase (sialic acid O-acetyltransferase NeuD family)
LSLPQILLIGAGGHAAACIDVIEQEHRFQIAGILGLPEEVGRTVLGYSVLGVDSDLGNYAARYQHALVCIGQIKSPKLRIKLYDSLKSAGFNLPTIISPTAHVSTHAVLGEGTIVMHGTIINARASIGRNCIINSRALVEHDVQIGDHCHVATAVVVNGGVFVGTGSFIGSNSAIRQSVKIGEHCVIGMGEVVKSDCTAGQTLASPQRAR